MRGTKATFSRIVLRLSSLKSWKTTPTERRSSGICAVGNRGDVAPAHEDLPLGGQLLAEDQLQEGGLARAATGRSGSRTRPCPRGG